ncbi:Tyrosine-protein kinase [Aphelenchoides besseyi]|nr:Tyrosine-protein kinase [Aphelenchoides besseyi]
MWRKFVHPATQATDEKNVATGREKRPVHRAASNTKTPKGSKASVETGNKSRPKKLEDKTDELDVGQTMVSEDGAEERRGKVGSRVYKSKCEAEASTLLNQSWYHGLMPRDEIEDLLAKDGDFLVRMTDLDNAQRLAVSVRWKGRAKHILFKLDKSQRWMIRADAPFDTVIQLINFYVSSKAELQSEGTKLINPIKRPDWYILHDSIRLGKKLGSGSFGDVFLAQLTSNGKTADVAVKTLKGKMGKQERVNFVKEASINRRLVHPNVVRMLGVASQKEPIIVVLELAPGGSLKSYCKEHAANLSTDKMIKFLTDAARGLKYLASKNVIHRDGKSCYDFLQIRSFFTVVIVVQQTIIISLFYIAARNCLLAADLTVKISDFGLSVTTAEKREQKLQKLPVRYLAPEILRCGTFSQKSDVWSFGKSVILSYLFVFGVMIWEVFTYCKSEPYPGLTNAEAKALVLSGKHMDTPANMPSHISALTLSCWNQNVDDRPSFSAIVKQLSPALLEDPTLVTEDA